MSESLVIQKSRQEPQTIYLKDYQVPPYLVDEINLDFELHEDETLVKSILKIRHNRHSPDKTRKLILNGEELILVSVLLNGEALSSDQYEVTDQNLIIPDVPDSFDLTITTKIYPRKNTALSGLYSSANAFCTQCEAEGFRRITYFPDHPDVLARYTTTITADAARYPYLLSNGNLVDSGKRSDGRHWAKWEDPFKKPSYLFALVAGDFDLIEDQFTTQSGRNILLHIYVEKGYADQAHHAMYALKEAMRWDEKAYGREYDLDIYMIVAISDFNMGAMENKGLNIFNTKYVLAKPETATDDDYIHIMSVVGHEYFHNWTGNRVTCRDWFQLSLKEGLTIFRDQSFTEDVLSRAVMRIRDVNHLREIQFPEDAGPLAHPVRPESYIEINNFYTSTVYNKGAEVLRMLQTILGPALFRKGMDLYFARHDGQAVTIEDYVKTMEDVSGINLAQFRLWYSQAGTPIVTVQGDYDFKKQQYTLTLQQTCPPTPDQAYKKPMHIPVKMGLLDQKGHAIPLQLNDEPFETEKVLHLTTPSQTFRFNNVPSQPIPSLLRNFSAPVKLKYAYSDEELLFLFKHDTDAFNRWEAGQQYMLRLILQLVQDYTQEKTLHLPQDMLDIFAFILKQDTNDKLMIAEMLVLPSERYIGEQMNVIDVDSIHAVREFILAQTAYQLHALLLETYHQYHDPAGEYRFNMEAVGKRQLKNLCLSYLMHLPQYDELGMQQFEASLKSNMTDTLAALTALSNIDSPLRTKALDQFYAVWQQDALVVDKWFAIQAATKLPIALPQVRKLMQHEAFDIKNPNKVYSLIGTFGHRNAIRFHSLDGEGYAYLREAVHQLDKLNPQVAARMVKPLTTWKRYDKERQELMREQLELLLHDKKLSTDLYELVTKSLE
ncbi:aminopeptidase N [Aquicella lusitana]|uniref:Aminopeptidase N n=1 Tax=Aquicella lusitana TaxID=254246 RepID=A0A370H422_9COXI|nr:aminopeptidase N [Aquicella lusitana]RDI48804.1 aminopeptidase N [Aquicella lusitana]VVC73232.1 Aminopeptidase N [Aquicella lusitana]